MMDPPRAEECLSAHIGQYWHQSLNLLAASSVLFLFIFSLTFVLCCSNVAWNNYDINEHKEVDI